MLHIFSRFPPSDLYQCTLVRKAWNPQATFEYFARLIIDPPLFISFLRTGTRNWRSLNTQGHRFKSLTLQQPTIRGPVLTQKEMHQILNCLQRLKIIDFDTDMLYVPTYVNLL